MAPTTVPHPPSSSKSYRDATVRGPHPSRGPSSLSPAPSPEVLPEPMLTSSHVALLQQRFPERVTISTEKFVAATAAWSNGLIGKFLGRDVAPDTILSTLSPVWSHLGEWELFPMTNGFFVIRFVSPEARDEVLYGGPWIVDGAVLALSPFDPAFRPSADHLVRAVLWVRLPELPPGFWADEIISDILSVVGRVVRLDDHTRLRTRGRFARAAVEVDLRQPLRPGVTVDVENAAVPPFWQTFQYENVHQFCLRCRRVGHKVQTCHPSSEVSSTDDSGLGSSVAPSFSSSSTATAEALPTSWAASLMVRRPPRRSPASDSSSRPPRAKGSRAPPSPRSLGAHLKEQQLQHQLSPPMPAHVVLGPTSMGVESLPMPAHVGLGPTSTSEPKPTPCAAASHGPSDGPVGSNGQSSPHTFFTSAAGLKQVEPECSHPPSSVQPEQHFEGVVDGVHAVGEVTERERRLIQQIMEEDLDSNSDFVDEADIIEDDVLFTTVGKKKKSKGKFPAICLRPAPRDRASMKRTKVAPSSSAGKFSLLADLLGGMPPEEIVARHGPPEG